MVRQTALGSQRTVSLLLTQRRCSALVLWLVHICRAGSTEGDPLRPPLRTLREDLMRVPLGRLEIAGQMYHCEK